MEEHHNLIRPEGGDGDVMMQGGDAMMQGPLAEPSLAPIAGPLSGKELLEARIKSANCLIPGGTSFPFLPQKPDVFQVVRTALKLQFKFSCHGVEGTPQAFRIGVGNFMMQCCTQYTSVKPAGMNQHSFFEFCRFISETNESLYDGCTGAYAKYIPNVLSAVCIRHNVSLYLINEKQAERGSNYFELGHFTNEQRNLYLFEVCSMDQPSYYVPLHRASEPAVEQQLPPGPAADIQAQFPPGTNISDLDRDLILILKANNISVKKSITVEKNSKGEETHTRARVKCSRGGKPPTRDTDTVERNSSTIKLNCVFVIQLKKFPGDCTWTIQQNSVYEHTNGCQPGEEQMKATSKKSGNGSPPQPELFEIFKGFVIQNSTCKQMRCSLNSLGLLLDMSAEHLLNMKYRTRHMLEKMKVGSSDIEPKTIQEIFNVSDVELDPLSLYLNEMVINRSDDESISKCLQSLSRQFPDFKYDVAVDDKNKMQAIVWATGRMLQRLELYGDVAQFDATAKTNKENWALWNLVVFDEHRLPGIGCRAVSFGEKGDDYQEFIFTTVIKWVPKFKYLKSVVTDQGTSESLVHRIFTPECGALLCVWHIENKNLKENLKKVVDSDIWIAFIVSHLIEAKSEEEYVASYRKLQDDGPEAVFSYYSRNLHSLRHRFSQPWRLKYFSAGFKASSMAECENSALKRAYILPGMNLQDVLRSSVLQEVQKEDTECRRRTEYRMFGSRSAKVSSNDAVKNVAASVGEFAVSRF